MESTETADGSIGIRHRRLSVAVWLTRHDAATGSTAGIGARCWVRRGERVSNGGHTTPAERTAWAAEHTSCGDLPRVATAPPGWVAVGPSAHRAQLLSTSRPPSLHLEQHEWATLERWAVGHQDPDLDPPMTGPLSSRRALATRAAALAFAEQLVSGKCLLLFEVTSRCEVAHHKRSLGGSSQIMFNQIMSSQIMQRPSLTLQREALTALHLPSREKVYFA